MGAAAGTLSAASDAQGEAFVKKLRVELPKVQGGGEKSAALAPALLAAAFDGSPPPDDAGEQTALVAKFIETDDGAASDLDLWKALKAAVAPASPSKGGAATEDEDDTIDFVPRKPSGRRVSKTDEIKNEMGILKYDPAKTEEDSGELMTTYLINPEFKRPGMKRRVPYPPLPPDKPRPFEKGLVGAFSCHGQVDVGKYKDNQDRGVVAHPFAASGPGKQALFIVCDGHGEYGHKVSDYVVKLLVDTLQNHESLRDDPGKALSESYTHVDTALEKTRIDSYTSGTTCVTVLARKGPDGTKLHIANCGDSRAIIGKVRTPPGPGEPIKFEPFDLTKDQKPDDPSEQARITAAGGFVSCPPWSASARVWLDAECQWPGLAMARSIGDHCVKDIGVTSTPDVGEYVIQPEDKVMILASDGIWEFLESQDALDIVAAALMKHDGDPDKTDKACQELIKCAMRQWKIHEQGYRDDITVSLTMLEDATMFR